MLRIKRLQEEIEERERELMEANERLRHMSQTDALTGLDNRRHIETRIEEMFEHAKRLAEPFSCVMVDLDRFKSVNDTYGHQAGRPRAEAARQDLKHEVREVDHAGRYGGEEFVLLLTGTVLDAAVTFAERVRKADRVPYIHLRRGFRSSEPPASGSPRGPTEDFGPRRTGESGRRIPLCRERNCRNRVIRFDSDVFNAHLAAEPDGAEHLEAADRR